MNYLKSMRKILISFLAIVCLSIACTEKASAQFRYGPTAGMDISTMKFKQDLITVNSLTGFSAGIMAEMMFPGIGFGLDLGMNYQLQGAKLHLGEKELWAWQGLGTELVYLHTVQVPVHLRFKYTRLNGLEDKIAPLAYAGPCFNFTVAHSGIKPLNYPGGNLALDFGIGAEIFKNWQVTGSYSLGMTYCLSAKVLKNYSARIRTWNIRVAYLF